MNTAKASFPKLGTKITYAEALTAYNELERYMLSRIYSPSFMDNVEAYDLLWHLEGVASKQGIDDGRAFHSLRRHMCSFAIERTALANGSNGERFYLLDDEKALSLHDETHLFEVGIDGTALREEFDAFLALLQEGSSLDGDTYARTYSPLRREAERSEDREDSRLKRLVEVGFVALISAIVICAVGRAATSFAVCFKLLS